MTELTPRGGVGITVVRVVLVGLGLVSGISGVILLWDNPIEVLTKIAIWAGVGVVVHDFVFAPLCALLGWTGAKVIPARWWTPVSVAGLLTVVLLLLAIPVYDRPGANPTNPSALDRDYPHGLLIALIVVWAGVPLFYAARRVLPVRQNQVVEDQSAADVEGQPKSV